MKSVEGIEDSDTRTAAAITLAAGIHWAEQHPHWIPVEERLPEERKVVWVRKHFNKEVLGEFDIYDSAAFCNGEFQCDNSCTVTHWMEIVPPRKEE